MEKKKRRKKRINHEIFCEMCHEVVHDDENCLIEFLPNDPTELKDLDFNIDKSPIFSIFAYHTDCKDYTVKHLKPICWVCNSEINANEPSSIEFWEHKKKQMRYKCQECINKERKNAKP